MFGVIGATGQTGSGVVRTLFGQGKAVRAIVRNAEAARALFGPGPEVVTADLHDPDSVARALGGVTHLYVGLGRAPDLFEIEQSVVVAARRVGVRQYVKCSGVVVGVDQPSRIQQQHGALEDLVRAQVPHTILAPNFFLQNFLGLAGAVRAGVLPLPTGAARAGLIDADDIVASAVAVLGHEEHLGRRYQLTGPESLSHGDAARIFSEVLRRPVAFADVPEAVFIDACAGAGMPRWFAGLLADVYVRFFGSGACDITTDSVQVLTGRAPRSLEAWLRDNAAAFAG